VCFTVHTESTYNTYFAHKGLIAFISYGCMDDVQVSGLYLVISLGDKITQEFLFYSHFINILLQLTMS
jgi:hypothetical protein